MMMKIFLLALALSVVSAGPFDLNSAAIQPGDSDVDIETNNFLQLNRNDFLADSYAEAEEYIQAEPNKSKCDSMVKASEDGVKKNVKAQQDRINKIENGTACLQKGQGEVLTAKNAMATAALHLKNAQKNLTDAQNTPITWKYIFSSVSESNPSKFWKASQYLLVKALVKKAKAAVATATGVLAQANATYATAVKSAKAKKLKCQCATYQNMLKEVNTTNAAINSSNIKAWTKGAHLACVLAGTPMNKCVVKPMPTVVAAKLATGVGKSACAAEGDKDLLQDSCKGFRVETTCSGGQFAYQMYTTTKWDKTRKYHCPTGWHYSKAAEYFDYMYKQGCHDNTGKSSGNYASYKLCGHSGHNYNNGGKKWYGYQFTFADSASNNRYQHGGNYVGYQKNTGITGTNYWAGIICAKGM
jgi:hypothetical protein